MSSELAKKRLILVFLTVGVWSLVFLLSFKSFPLAARSPTTLSITSDPANIRLRVDGKYYGNGYLSTPLKIKIPSGRHQIKVVREGYIAQIMNILGNPNDVINMENIVLEKDRRFAFSAVEINHIGQQPIQFEVNSGFASGETPRTVENLIRTKAHVITFFPNWPNTHDKERCKLVFPNDSGSQDSSIDNMSVVTVKSLKLRNGRTRLKITGCKKLRRKKH